jgi:RNA polymerase primary sigma factor
MLTSLRSLGRRGRSSARSVFQCDFLHYREVISSKQLLENRKAAIATSPTSHEKNHYAMERTEPQCWRFLLCLLLASDTVQGMALSSKLTESRAAKLAPTTSLSNSCLIANSADRWKTLYPVQKELRTPWGVTANDDEHESIFEDYDDELLEFEVDFFQELQRSTGSEILDDQLQSQIDLATTNRNPNRFLDAHISDATYLEKVAMSSITEQLPQPAVNALRKRINRNSKNLSTKKQGLQFSSVQRVSPDEEIQLAKMIQRGVRLHKIKADYEEANGQRLSRSDWAKLAGLDSPTELRREVATYRRAKQLLVSANVGLVHAVVKKQASKAKQRSGLGYEELVQEGSLGLLRAAELFDSSRGLRFSTYATIWIKGALSNSHVMETIKLPAREKTMWNKIVKTHEQLAKEQGLVDQEPTIEQIATRMGVNVEDVVVVQRRVRQTKCVLSLDYEYKVQSRSGDDYGGKEALENDKNFQSDADLAERTQMQADVVATLAKNLTPREARLMRLRYGLTDGQTRSLRECAEAMGLSETRVQQLSKECLKKLREAAEAESLEEYLLTIA